MKVFAQFRQTLLEARLAATVCLFAPAFLAAAAARAETTYTRQTITIDQVATATVSQTGKYRLRNHGHLHYWLPGTLNPTPYGDNYAYSDWTLSYDLSSMPRDSNSVHDTNRLPAGTAGRRQVRPGSARLTTKADWLGILAPERGKAAGPAPGGLTAV